MSGGRQLTPQRSSAPAYPADADARYLYDLELPAPGSAEYVTPRPHDDEVESFEVRFRCPALPRSAGSANAAGNSSYSS